VFCIRDIKASNVVVLQHRKSEYIVTDAVELFDVNTGKIFGSLAQSFDDIDKVFDNRGQLLAVRRQNKLLKYSPVYHDKDLNYIKNVNRLLTYVELEKALKAQNVYYGLLHINYKKTLKGNQVLKIYTGTKKFKCEFGSYLGIFIEKKASRCGHEYTTGAKRNVQINVYRFLVDNKRKIYLYSYTITPSIL